MMPNRAQRVGARYILRRIRNEDDYTYKRGMQYVNAELAPGVLAVFLMPPLFYKFLERRRAKRDAAR